MKKLLSLFFILLMSFSIYAEDCTHSDNSERGDAEEQIQSDSGGDTTRPDSASQDS